MVVFKLVGKSLVGYLFFLLCFVSWGMAEEKIQILAPLGGWRNSFGELIKYTQKINYPASFVSTQKKQSKFALIQGQIQGHKKENKKPFTLVVNGIGMPLRINSQGKFSRPFSFGSGSNSVTIRSPYGKAKSSVQFYEAYSGRSESRLRVLLSWNADATDLDLHVVTPLGEHAYYANRVLKKGGALDIDVTTGYGPEIFSSAAPKKGTYLVYVNYYGSGRSKANKVISATITTITQENTLDEKVHSVVIPMRKAGELTLVHSFVYP
jgi:uncharacterized protein YfaP (DUF2135 family)